jgi:trimeric autotransporter adhesin
VFAPGGALAGTTDVLTITANDATGSACLSASATDTTTVNTGQLRLNKVQALDVGCDGTPDAPGYTANQLSAEPGQCVMYQVTATNEGTNQVTNVTISDSTPAFTTLDTQTACSAGLEDSLAVGSTGQVSCSGIASIPANGTATLTFGVQIVPLAP